MDKYWFSIALGILIVVTLIDLFRNQSKKKQQSKKYHANEYVCAACGRPTVDPATKICGACKYHQGKDKFELD